MPVPRISRAFALTGAAGEVARRLPPLVVLRAPRGFGKTSTAAAYATAPSASRGEVVWVTVPDGPLTGEDLWRAVCEELLHAGLATADERPGPAAVRSALRGLERPLLLVLDGLHNVRDTDVDSVLVDLVQEHGFLNLVVTSRAERPLEHLGPATVDAVVLRVRDLVLSDEDTRALAGRLGLALSAEEAARLRRDLVGWPALVRAVVLDSSRRADGTLDLDLTPLEHYVSAVLHDPDFAAYYRVVTALAVPRSFTLAEAGHIAGEDRVEHKVQDLRDAGVITSDGNGALTVIPTLRAAVQAVLERDDPVRFRRVHRIVADDADVPVTAALEHAVKAAVWPSVVEMVEDHWTSLLRNHPGTLRAVLAAVPDDVVASSARLLLARDHILDTRSTSRAERALRAGLLTPEGVFVGATPTTTQRLAMRSLTAWGSGGPLTHGIRDERLDAEVRDALPLVLVEWALDAVGDMDLLGAAYSFALASRWARTGAVAREAAAGAGLALIMLGHIAPARRWLAHAASISDEVPDLERIARPLVELLDATLRLRDVEPPPVHRLPPGSPLVPLAALARVVAVHAAVFRGDTSGVVPVIEHVRTVRAGQGAEGLLAAATTSLLTDAHLVEGDFDRSSALLAEADAHPHAVVTARARHALLVGANGEALRLTEAATDQAATAPRAALELLVVRASAAWRAGEHERAVSALSTAVALAEDVGILLPFLAVPRGDLAAVAAEHPVLAEFLATEPLASARSPFPEPLRVSELSVAELRVLEHLVGPRSLAHIARVLYVSESTVKTHVQRIYRKLGVTTRAGAVTRARELAILRAGGGGGGAQRR